MFKIARTAKQIFNVARNVPKSLLSSINGGLKYCSQSKGYIEDASYEFSFLKAPQGQSSKPLIQDKFKAIIPNTQNIAEAKSTPLLDSAEIRKLIYARFADEIAAKPGDAEKNQSFETKSHATREHVETFTTYNIVEEFKELKTQGYDFVAARKAIENQNVKSLSQHMKELVLSGHISSYSGEAGLKEEVAELMDKHVLVIKEFMQKVQDRAGFESVDNAVLLVDSENGESMTDDVTKADLLGEY
ncbi:MAG TPA: hypothetical protein LFV91_06850 [Rickettsia endosymbiont of Bembidion nr. Transversale]|nr:hypothetical protein [Rickettsia endosymbiont of Bembidion nr. Transversale]